MVSGVRLCLSGLVILCYRLCQYQAVIYSNYLVPFQEVQLIEIHYYYYVFIGFSLKDWTINSCTIYHVECCGKSIWSTQQQSRVFIISMSVRSNESEYLHTILFIGKIFTLCLIYNISIPPTIQYLLAKQCKHILMQKKFFIQQTGKLYHCKKM